MTSRDIPDRQWHDFLNRFSRQHAGWLVKVEVLAHGQTQLTACELPFQSIVLGSSGGSIIIVVGDRSTHLTHVIAEPERVCLSETSEGAHEAIEIAARDDRLIRLRFRVSVLTETVDGIAPSTSRA